MGKVNVDPSGEYLTLVDGEFTSRFHAVWLRDNAWDENTRSPANGQRLISLRDIPKKTKIAKASIDGEKVSILFEPESESINYDISWLKINAYDCSQPSTNGWIDPGVELWDSALMDRVPVGDFSELRTDVVALRGWLGLVAKFGFGKVVNGPVSDGALFKIVDLFGYVRQTNYGSKFEVRTEVNPTNLAFTGLALQAHTDNPYRDPVPSIQVLYCLESSALGGENMVVDGFNAAQILREENEEQV